MIYFHLCLFHAIFHRPKFLTVVSLFYSGCFATLKYCLNLKIGDLMHPLFHSSHFTVLLFSVQVDSVEFQGTWPDFYYSSTFQSAKLFQDSRVNKKHNCAAYAEMFYLTRNCYTASGKQRESNGRPGTSMTSPRREPSYPRFYLLTFCPLNSWIMR